MFLSLFRVVTLVVTGFALTGCGGGAPSEADIKTAFDRQMNQDLNDLRALRGGAGASMVNSMPKISFGKKIGCKDDGEKAYLCDVEIGANLDGQTKNTAVKVRMVRGNDGWLMSKGG